MTERGIGQRELAAALGVSIDRVKSLTAGRAKKLSQEEIRAFVERLNVRAEYLATGERPIFRAAHGVRQSEKNTPAPSASQALRGVSETVPNYYFDDTRRLPQDGVEEERERAPNASAELGMVGRAAAIADEALIAAGLRRRATPDQFGTLCVITFALLARGSSAAAAREMLDQVLALCQPAQTTAEAGTGAAETTSAEPAEEAS